MFWKPKISPICSLEIFKGIDKKVVEEIIKSCEIRSYNSWENIITEWEKSNWEWYILKSWKVSISIWWTKIAELSEGNIFWEIALLNEETRTASIKALSKIEVIVLSLTNLINMINNDDNTINKTIMNRIEENLERWM